MAMGCTIIIEGELDQRFHDTFEDLTLTTDAGRSVLRGQVADRAALQGLLRQLYDLGLNVVSFTTHAATHAAPPPQSTGPNHPGDRPAG